MNQFNEKFEKDDTHHSFALRADGCFKRHDLPREKQQLSKSENRIRNFETPNKAEFAEWRLMNKVAYLQKIGCEFKADETLEEYVSRNENKLEKRDY